jgi:hypothetical protein
LMFSYWIDRPCVWKLRKKNELKTKYEKLWKHMGKKNLKHWILETWNKYETMKKFR